MLNASRRTKFIASDEGEEGGDGTVAVALAGLVHCGSSWWSRDWGLGIGDSASRPALSPTPNPVSRIPAFPQDSPPAVTFSCAIGHRGDPLPGRGAQETRAEQDGGDHQAGDQTDPQHARAPAQPPPEPGAQRHADAPVRSE